MGQTVALQCTLQTAQDCEAKEGAVEGEADLAAAASEHGLDAVGVLDKRVIRDRLDVVVAVATQRLRTRVGAVPFARRRLLIRRGYLQLTGTDLLVQRLAGHRLLFLSFFRFRRCCVVAILGPARLGWAGFLAVGRRVEGLLCPVGNQQERQKEQRERGELGEVVVGH